MAIEEIAVGDRVLSRSDRDAAGGVGFKEVRQTFVTHPAHLVHLAYRRIHCSSSAAVGRESAGPPRADGNGGGDLAEDDDGEGEPPSAILTGTPEHPFWSLDRDAWVPLGDLAPGERLLLADGSTGIVVGLDFEDAPAGQTFTTYNLDVADHHTYYVLPADSADDALAVWVHNRRCAAVEAAEAAQEGVANAGRAGKQARLRELAEDPNVSSADKGWLKQQINQVERGKRKTIRNPPGEDLAHERGREAAKGFSYQYSNLANRADHRIQHKYDGWGRLNRERPAP